jgi:hypothetical protein
MIGLFACPQLEPNRVEVAGRGVPLTIWVGVIVWLFLIGGHLLDVLSRGLSWLLRVGLHLRWVTINIVDRIIAVATGCDCGGDDECQKG